VIGKIKTTSCLWIGQTHAASSGFRWQAGYAVFSVSQSNVEAVRAYICNQPEHRRKHRFKTKCVNSFVVMRSKWDERYVWD
jgi:hypothetical protein